MAPPSGNVSRPGRALAGLAALIVVLLLAIVGGNIGSPGQWGKDFKVHLGLDLTSGTTVALKANAPKGVSSAQFAADMTQAKNIMANRVNGAGFTEAQVQQQGSDIINVAVPGAGSQKVVDLVGTTAQLLFRQVILEAPNKGATTPVTTPTPTPSASGSASPTPSASASPTASASASSTAKNGALGSREGGVRRGRGEGDGQPVPQPDRGTRRGVRHPVGLRVRERPGQRDPGGQRVRLAVGGQRLRRLHGGGRHR